MRNDFNNDSLLELYLFEATTVLDNLDALLLRVEARRRFTPSNVNEIFRIMHTIKGSSAMMDFDTIADVSHKAEELFAIVRDNGLNNTHVGELFAVTLRVLTFLASEVKKVQAGTKLTDGNPALIGEIDALIETYEADLPESRRRPDFRKMIRGVLTNPTDEKDTPKTDSANMPDETVEEHSTANAPMNQNIINMDLTKFDSLLDLVGEIGINEPQDGTDTSILLKIPPTFSIIPCMEVRLGKKIFFIPIGNIRKCFKASTDQLRRDPAGNEMILLSGNAYPVVRLHEQFGIEDGVKEIDEGILLLTNAGDRMGCLFADELIGTFRIVCQALPAYLNHFKVRSAGISGCTIMSNGEIRFILDVQKLLS
ncbi:MAG: chemotaxis protein CheW [Clostridiales Family XIII bacterium]|jgi:chemotaxis protein histidine kinase CheA|nr:chemotaxis protein CheW [Clostridiales Family XIII bacterium]